MSNNLMEQLLNRAREAQQTSQSGNGSGRKYPYTSIFIKPSGPGVRPQLKVRILYPHGVLNAGNPDVPFQFVAYQWYLHKIDKQPVTCGKNDPKNPTCDLCNAVAEKKSVTGVEDPSAVSRRSIIVAQYVSSVGYDWDAQHPEPRMGDIVLVQGPATLYTTIAELVPQLGDNMTKVFINREAFVVNIGRDTEGRKILATPTYEQIRSAPDDATYRAMLASIPPLEHIALFGGVSEDDRSRLRQAALNIKRSLGAMNTRPQPTPGQLAETITPIYAAPQPVSPGNLSPQYQQQPTVTEAPMNNWSPQQYQQPVAEAPVLPNWATQHQAAAPAQQPWTPQPVAAPAQQPWTPQPVAAPAQQQQQQWSTQQQQPFASAPQPWASQPAAVTPSMQQPTMAAAPQAPAAPSTPPLGVWPPVGAPETFKNGSLDNSPIPAAHTVDLDMIKKTPAAVNPVATPIHSDALPDSLMPMPEDASPYCVRKYNAASPTCMLCAAEPNCPFKGK